MKYFLGEVNRGTKGKPKLALLETKYAAWEGKSQRK